MEIDYRRNRVTDEKIICEKLRDFPALFDELAFEEQAELIGLLVKDIRVSRFDPEQDELPCDKEVFTTQIRTSWYRGDLRMFSNHLNISQMLGNLKELPEFPNNDKSGGRGEIRTHGRFL